MDDTWKQLTNRLDKSLQQQTGQVDLEQLVKRALEVTFGAADAISLDGLSSDERIITEASLSLLVCGARNNVDCASFSKMLTDSSLGADVKLVFSTAYQDNFEKLRSVLSTVGWRPSQIVDVDWKISHQVQTNNRTTGEALCTFDLKVLDCAAKAPTDLTFQCSSEQLQGGATKVHLLAALFKQICSVLDHSAIWLGHGLEIT